MRESFAGFDRSADGGVPLLHRREPGSKTFRIVVLWRRPLDGDQAARAILPALLQHGTAKHPDRPSLVRAREERFGASTSFSTGRHGEHAVLTLRADAVASPFLPGAPDQFGALVDLLGEHWQTPRLTTPGLPAAVFAREHAQALADARAVREDRGRFARLSAVLFACEGELYGVPEHGGEAAIEALTATAAAQAFAAWRSASVPVVLAAGHLPDDPEKALAPLVAAVRPAAAIELPRAVEPSVRAARRRRDAVPMQQAKVVLVLRTPAPRSPREFAALQVFCSMWGGGPHSRLFTEVREKRSLCYYASVGGDADKGLLLVQSGCEAHAVEAVVEQCLAQRDELANARFADAELATAIAVCQGPLRSLDDSPAARLSFTAEQFLRGLDEDPAQRVQNLAAVTRDDVAARARATWLDVDYALLPESPAREATGGER